MKKQNKDQLNAKKKTNKKPSSKREKISNKAKFKYDEARQIDWSYIDGPINWD